MKNPPTAVLGPVDGAGWPVISRATGKVDGVVLRSFLRHDYAIAYPPGRNPGASLALEALRNNGMTMVAKITLSHLWGEHDGTTFTGALVLAAERTGALEHGRVNLTVPGMPEEVVRLIRLHIVTPALQGHGIPWRGVQIEGDHSELLWRLLHESMPLDWILWWNGGAPTIEAWRGRNRCGVMLENFPFQGGKPRDWAGAFTTLLNWRKTYDLPLIFTAAAEGELSNPAVVALNARKHDYGIACAFAFNGVAIFAGGEPNSVPWWELNLPQYDLGAPIDDLHNTGNYYWVRRGERGSIRLDPRYPRWDGDPAARGMAWIEGGIPPIKRGALTT